MKIIYPYGSPIDVSVVVLPPAPLEAPLAHPAAVTAGSVAPPVPQVVDVRAEAPRVSSVVLSQPPGTSDSPSAPTGLLLGTKPSLRPICAMPLHDSPQLDFQIAPAIVEILPTVRPAEIPGAPVPLALGSGVPFAKSQRNDRSSVVPLAAFGGSTLTWKKLFRNSTVLVGY